MNYRYSLIIQWSDEDQLYLVTIPEFAELVMQPCTHGKTYEEVGRNAQEAIESYLEVLPGREDYATSTQSSTSCLSFE